jgi:hypothetical protein
VRLVTGKRRWLAAAAVAAILSSQAATRSLDALVDAVIRHGPDSHLPAHLSMILGVSASEQQTPVKQAVIRDGYTVRTFNVCTANHADLVMLTYNEQNLSTKAYLVSAAGALRKAVYYQAGGAANERPLSAAQSDFSKEFGFWANFRDPSARAGEAAVSAPDGRR